MTARDDEPTVRIRKSSVPSGVFAARTPVSVQPSPTRVHEAADQLDRDWRNEVAVLQRENEEMRHRNAGLLDENAQLRDALAKIRGPR